jgi:hypothetical protein
MMRLSAGLLWLVPAAALAVEGAPALDREIAPLLKAHCVKCHGPAKAEGGLNLSTSAGIHRGGKNGAVVRPHDIKGSRLWERVESDEMPPDEPLEPAQKELLRRWIIAGAPGLARTEPGETPEADHWAFQKLSSPPLPALKAPQPAGNEIDRFIGAALEARGLGPGPEADRRTLIRRVSFDLTGLPPTIADLEAFLADSSSGAYARMVDRYLAAPEYGERWGKFWLDAAGYADSNGYFNADTDRPLAYRYRDYVIRAFNQDRPFDQFVREQLAGDELAGYVPGTPATPAIIELLEATHFLRNGQDGSGESDGNPDEVRVDRYAALESAMQNTATALLGLTVQCAKCHSHKFEPISHQDYYQWQAVFYPAFNIDTWVKPNDRIVYAPLPGEHERWERETRDLEARVSLVRSELKEWVRTHQPRGELLFEDTFDTAGMRLADRWSATAPGDDAPGGAVPVNLDADTPPAARIRDGHLQILEGNTQGDSWLSTRRPFDWTPDVEGESIQVTFDLVDHRLDAAGTPAFRIGYLIALHDFNDNGPVPGGNLLIDGNPAGSTPVHLDYPGSDSRGIGEIGTTGYTPGHSYGLRLTSIGPGKGKDKGNRIRLEHLVDGVPEDKSIELAAADLPDGGFGFEYCCGRSFVVDNVRVERFAATGGEDSPLAVFRKELKARQEALNQTIAAQKTLAGNRPGKIAWVSAMSPQTPTVHLLERGNYAAPGPVVEPGAFSVLVDPGTNFSGSEGTARPGATGPRLALARWVTAPDSRGAALMARVQVNRIWQQHFGTGIVATPDNLGLSGAPPTHPQLLDWLAERFVRSGWSVKALHRLILNSATYRQTSALAKTAYDADPDNHLLWRYPVRRLEAEAIRDAMLAVSGSLDRTAGGPYVPTTRNTAGEVIVADSTPGASRRSVYLYQRRTQVLSFLAVFDAPSIVFNSVRRAQSTMPLQSLSLLNSDFALLCARRLAERLQREAADDAQRVSLAHRLLLGREPTADETREFLAFLDAQAREYGTAGNDPAPRERAWHDFCQALLSCNEFLYVN